MKVTEDRIGHGPWAATVFTAEAVLHGHDEGS